MKATYVWLALVGSLAGYVIYDYRSGAHDTLAAGEYKAFTITRADVTEFTLTRDGQTVKVAKDGDEWRLTEPLADFAEETAVDGFLFGLSNERLREFREGDQAGAPDYAKYGLDKPGVIVELKSKTVTERIEISAKSAFDGSFYVRRGNAILIGNAGLAQTTNRGLASLRSRRIWRHADADVTGARIAYAGNPKSNFALTHDARGWSPREKPDFTFDPERAATWVDAVQDLTVGEFVSEDTSPAQLKHYGLDRPAAVIQLDYAAGEATPAPWILTISPARGADVYFFTSDRAAIAKTTVAAMNKILAAPAYFRDGRGPFAVPIERATRVRVRLAAGPRLISKADGAASAGWRIDQPGEGESLNEAELQDLFANVRALKAVDFPPDAKPVAGEPNLEIRDRDGHVLLSLTIGPEYTPTAPWTSAMKLRAVRVGATTYGLPTAQIDTLIKERLVSRARASVQPKTAESPE